MTEYIYIVKCDGCEDEIFNFFTDARMQCDLVMSKRPTISQIEIERNDFGECTNSCDLGTVWSWEEAMNATDAEPAVNIFTQGDFAKYNPDNDVEFDSLDNSLEPEIEEISDDTRRPIPEGMTIEQLVEAMEENEDTVECTLCNDLFDKSTCRKELNLGWLCRRCADDLVARGEGPVFKEDSYWDFLDEDLDDTRTLADLVKDSINHLTNDLGKDPLAEDFTDDVIIDMENNYDIEVPEDPKKYRDWASAIACEVSRQLNNQLDEDLEWHTYKITFSTKANPDKEQTVMFKTWQSDVEYAWRKSNENIPHTTIKNIELVEELREPEKSSMLEELEDPNKYRERLSLCPECGTYSYDPETGICINCGFN